MVPLLTGKGTLKTHEFLYWEFHEGGTKQAARMGKWKAVRFGTEEPLELYDLSSDIHEDINRASVHPEIVAKIESYFDHARTESAIRRTETHWVAEKTKN